MPSPIFYWFIFYKKHIMQFFKHCLLLILIIFGGLNCHGHKKPEGSTLKESHDSSDPNIIIIITDDQGYSDIGCYGGELNTPNLDRLANEGMRLSHFYNSAMCIASRSCLMTSNYPVSSMPEFDQMAVIPEYLRKEGYENALIGKWHLPGSPMDRGFDHFFGFLGGFSDHFSGSHDYRLNRNIYNDFDEDYYSTDVFTEHALSFIDSVASSKESAPFFLMLSYQAPHNPLQAPHEEIMKHRGKYLSGWQSVREARFERQKELGLVPVDAELPKYPENLPQWDDLSKAQKDLEDLRMAVFAAMVEGIDNGVGQVMAALKKYDIADNTLVLFMSDNGTDSFSVMDSVLLKKNILPGDRNSNFQPGRGWAYASVTPWRLYKISQHGGGVTTGAIAWWPDGLNADAGSIVSTPVHKVDLLPTIMDVVNSKFSTDSVSGESFLPLLKGEKWKREKPLFFQFADNRAIRTKKWTLVEVDDAGWELFHTPDDPFENHNLAQEYPDTVRYLSDMWNKWYRNESGGRKYTPDSTDDSPHYSPQGDRGSGKYYKPSAMPEKLKNRY